MYQKLIIIGNLGRDPEMRYTPDGKAVTSFSVAVDDSYTGGNGERVKRTLWVRVSAWGKLAETCNNYLEKGKKVLVEGTLTPDQDTGGPRVWSKQDGTPSAAYEVRASTVRFLSGKGEGAAASAGESATAEDIPF